MPGPTFIPILVAAALQTSPADMEKRWALYQTTSGKHGSAMVHVLVDKNQVCKSLSDPRRCAAEWDMLPLVLPPKSDNEVEYVQDFPEGPRRTRLAFDDYCRWRIAAATPRFNLRPCAEDWEQFKAMVNKQ